jgi:3-deoxy-D-manno-octulosonic-acid transferase
VTTILALLRAVHRRHPRVALWMTVTVTSIEVAATWHDARLLKTR